MALPPPASVEQHVVGDVAPSLAMSLTGVGGGPEALSTWPDPEPSRLVSLKVLGKIAA